MSFAIRPTNCERCGKSLSMFEGRYCLECQKEIDKETEIYEGNTGVFDEPYPWRPNDIIGILKHIIEVADTNSCGVKEIDGIDEEAINNAITIISSFEQIKWERDTAIAQLKELGYGFGQKIEPCGDCVNRQAVLDITWEEPSYTDALNVLTEVRDKVKSLPSVNPQEPKTGHWIRYKENCCYNKCSICEYEHCKESNYCPNCGARMAESEG